jgi:hypothetical protein
MHCTADTENGDYFDDPTEAQLAGLITGLEQATGTIITMAPADVSQDWYAPISLLPDGTSKVEHGDPARDEHYGPSGLARDLTRWLSTRS